MITTTANGFDIDLRLSDQAGGKVERSAPEGLDATVREAVVCALYRRRAVTKPEAASALGVSAWDLESEVFPRNGVFPNDGYGVESELALAAAIARRPVA